MGNGSDHIEIEIEGIRECLARWPYEGAAAEMVRELKYGRATSIVTELADALHEIAPESDLISWIPATPSRRRERGFDQCELLARALSHRSHTKVRRVLRRVDDVAQTSRDLQGRHDGPRFARSSLFRPTPPRVLLVDDVSTTGSTLSAAARVLACRGGVQVSAVVVAKVYPRGATPDGVRRSTL